MLKELGHDVGMEAILKNKAIILIGVGILILILIGLLTFNTFFGAPQSSPNTEANQQEEEMIIFTDTDGTEPVVTQEPEVEAEPETPEEETPVYTEENTKRFVVALNTEKEDVIESLYNQKLIKSKTAFSLAWTARGDGEFIPGAYRLSPAMDAFTTAGVLHSDPYMEWIVIPEGYRKEQIAELLTNTLGWTEEQKGKWIDTYTALRYDHIEGVYFPDTYLIPIAEPPVEVAERLIAKFNERFAPYLTRFNEQNIQWTTGLTMASVVQREAANDSDMPLIAGILWNRLDQNMYLNVDATLQYVRGDVGEGWWASISLEDKQIDSPYNTYKYRGLPPHPISNPGIPAIEAVLNPEETECLYYLHDREGNIHCSVTYEEHQENIQEYLIDQDSD